MAIFLLSIFGLQGVEDCWRLGPVAAWIGVLYQQVEKANAITRRG